MLLSDGSVLATGNNYFGQLGTGNTTDTSSFTKVYDPSNNSGVTCTAVSCGDIYTQMLLSDGSVLATGYNAYGQLGIGNTVDQTSFVNMLNSDGANMSNVLRLPEQFITGPVAPVAPVAPVITSVTSSSQSVKIYFTQTPTVSSITNYAYSYSKNSGTFTNFVDFSPAQTTSFLTLSGLINGHSYTFKLKAKNGPASYSAVSNVSSSVLIRPLLTEMITTSATITDMLNSGYTLQEMKDAGVKGDHPQNLSDLLYALSDFYPPHIKLSGDITSESAFSLRTTSNNPIQLIASGSDPVHLFVRS
jgi:hypothetical protein